MTRAVSWISALDRPTRISKSHAPGFHCLDAASYHAKARGFKATIAVLVSPGLSSIFAKPFWRACHGRVFLADVHLGDLGTCALTRVRHVVDTSYNAPSEWRSLV